MRTLILLLIAAICFPARADTPPAVKEQLRKLSRLPTINLSFGFGMNGADGLTFLTETRDPEPDIAALRKSMEGGLSDAQRYSELSRLLVRQDPKSPAAREALDKAIELFRQRLETQPENGLLLAQYGEALQAARRDQEAGKALRDAVRLAPKEWQPWVSLASFLEAQAFAAFVGGQSAAGLNQRSMAENARQNKPSADQIEQAQKQMAEAMSCYDKAVAAAPTEAKVYERRGAARGSSESFRALVRFVRGAENDANAVVTAAFGGAGQADFVQAVELDPKNYRTIGAAMMFEVMAAVSHPGGVQEMQGRIWDGLPEKAQNAVREGFARLQKLEDDPDQKVAAGALEVEGTLQFVIMRESTGSEAKLRRAVALDPAREQSWEMLAGLLAMSGRYEDLTAVVEQRLKQKDNPRNRFLLAKAREKLGQLDQAEAHLQAALKLDLDYVNALNGLAALLLKHNDEESFSEAVAHLKKAGDLVDKMPPGEQTDQQKEDLMFTQALCLALAGQTEDARKLLNQILEHDKESDGAKAALAAIGNP